MLSRFSLTNRENDHYDERGREVRYDGTRVLFHFVVERPGGEHRDSDVFEGSVILCVCHGV